MFFSPLPVISSRIKIFISFFKLLLDFNYDGDNDDLKQSVNFTQGILTRFVAFILVCTRMLNLRPAGHLEGSFGWCFPLSHLLSRVSHGPAMGKPTGVGCRAMEPTFALGIGQRGIGGGGKAFLLPPQHQSCATVMSESRMRLSPHLLPPVLT